MCVCIVLCVYDMCAYACMLCLHVCAQCCVWMSCESLCVVYTSGTAPQHSVCRAVQSLHISHMQMSIIEVFICRRLHMNTSMIPICIWLICRLYTALHTKCCGAVWCVHSVV